MSEPAPTGAVDTLDVAAASAIASLGDPPAEEKAKSPPKKGGKKGGAKTKGGDVAVPPLPPLGEGGVVAKKDTKAARKACSHEDCTHQVQTGGLCYKHAAETKQEEGSAPAALQPPAAEAPALSDAELDAFLLESSDWNTRYLQLKAYHEKNGTSHLKKVIPEADVADLTKEEAADLRALSRWTLRQRKLKRSGDMEHYKVLLMERLKFEWSPRAGHGPGKWNNQYEKLKEFKVKNGHVDVPFEHGKNKLALWIKTQLTLYRNGLEGKLPKLRPDRVQMLEELGVSWGVRKKGIDWEDRYKALCEYRDRFGHANVPWQWSENVALAQWVNSQRKKYKIKMDGQDGKQSNLTDEQIKKLNDLGFKWSTYGKGRYTAGGDSKEETGKAARKAGEVQDGTEGKPAAKKAKKDEPESVTVALSATVPPPLPAAEVESTDVKMEDAEDGEEKSSTRGGGKFAEWRNKNKGEEAPADDQMVSL